MPRSHLAKGTFIALNGTDGGANNGTILIGNNTVFEIGGASGAGPISVNDVGTIELELYRVADDPLSVTAASPIRRSLLAGGGKLTLSNNAIISSKVLPGRSSTTRTTPSAALAPSMSPRWIRSQRLRAIGVINADDSDPLTIKNGVLANAGTVKATSTGGLIFQDETVDNAGGTVEATTSGSVIDFVASSLSNGTLSTVAGSSIVIRSFGAPRSIRSL